MRGAQTSGRGSKLKHIERSHLRWNWSPPCRGVSGTSIWEDTVPGHSGEVIILSWWFRNVSRSSQRSWKWLGEECLGFPTETATPGTRSVAEDERRIDSSNPMQQLCVDNCVAHLSEKIISETRMIASASKPEA